MARRKHAGFTLAELMVVVAILGVLCALVVSLSTRSHGANARTTTERIVSVVGLAKLRASSTRRIQRIDVTRERVDLLQATTSGLVVTGATEWQLVQTFALPRGIAIWSAVDGVVTADGASVTETADLAHSIDVRPDGQANASTLYVTDGRSRARIVVYAATAAAHARAAW